MKLKTADLIVDINVNYDLMASRVKPYIYEGDDKADMVLEVSKEYYVDRQKENPHLSVGECEYLWSGVYFYEHLVKFSGVMLHSSCIEYKGKAYLFSAPSGTGKSTHTHLWLKYIEGTRIINDDKPAIRYIDGKFYAYGTPWSGKTNESINTGVEIGGIAFLTRGKNKIEKMSTLMALKNFMDQTVRPLDKTLMNDALNVLNKILTEIPIYSLTCDMSKDAVMTSLNGMVKD